MAAPVGIPSSLRGAYANKAARQSNLEAALRRNAKTQRDKQIAEHEQAHHHHD
jgi:hypothetical protein